MPTTQVTAGSSLELQEIADMMGKSKKVVVVTGAGISTNCGIPDFRSEHGLYSLIQAQYDAAVQNPPWEQENTFDIDDRPKKKRKQWYYEVVAPDGKVVDVIDEDLQPSQPQTTESTQELRRSSRSRSTNTTTSNSRASTPAAKSSDDSSLSSCPSTTPELPNDFSIGNTQITTAENALKGHPQARRSGTKSRSATPDSIAPTRKGTRISLHSAESTSSSTTSTSTSTSSSRRQSRSNSLNRQSIDSLASSTPIERTAERLSFAKDGPPLTRTRILQREESSILSKTDDEEDPLVLPASQSSSRASLPNLKGRDLFDSMIWSDPFTTSIFYMFISSLRQKIQDVESTTATHQFIRTLRDGGRLVRNYTQNIDCLEEREGLCTDLSKGPGNRARFNYRSQREIRPEIINGDHNLYGGVEVVPLHGTLTWLRCGLCTRLSNWDEEERVAATLAGTAPDCPACTEYNRHRTGKGRRGLAVGRLRPDIVLYGEEHPSANMISPLITHDLGLGPDVLLIMGTSLKVHGLKIMVKEFAKAVHTKGGKVVFVNRTKPPESTWGDVIDYWVEWDCDEWVLDLRERRADIWLPQGTIKDDDKRRESLGEDKPPPRKQSARPQATRDDKVNGVFVTFKILDLLAKATDADGKPATRFPYWQATTRVSNASAIQVEQPKKAKVQPSKRASKSLQAPKSVPPKQSTSAKSRSNKRKSYPECLKDDKNNVAYQVTKLWENLRKIAPGLGQPPKELQYPFLDLNNKPDYLKPFAFHSNSNHLPNVGGGSSAGWPLQHMNLVTHPPSGPPISVHSASARARTISHSYGTRASRRFSAAETTVVEGEGGRVSLSSQTSDTIVVATTEEEEGAKEESSLPSSLPTPPESNDAMTPSTQRIKRMGSIGAILSSDDGSEEWHDASEVL
ncbi:DHS-like NAD/FAD-binding domain-containing protein [Hyaloscypha variabilis F]|uniref:DHS-like NAD/FAD-binding domain-containing protein n=1 Tax=Hyaloscypha variabilis (strain UAMH 11265 / GT02V1 / F) TaxID=1149755 RepID=A0A2J6RBQ2_HYAVF|nr:DHS-like NAD/FAD-binding domain-containing protein [Hyaloscypha variabilis F]